MEEQPKKHVEIERKKNYRGKHKEALTDKIKTTLMQRTQTGRIEQRLPNTQR